MSLEMESYPLNLAHQQHRRADAHLMNNKYDEAMKCHQNAAELLEDAMKTTSSTAALESMSFQQTYHLKQKDLIESKKQQHFRVKKVVEHIKQGKDTSNAHGNECIKLQSALFKKLKDTDKLLQEFSNRKTAVNIDMNTINSQNLVIDDVQTNIQNMQPLLEKLLYQIELLKDENFSLRERVNYLEDERVKYLNLPSSYGDLGSKSYFALNTTSQDISSALGGMSFDDQIGPKSNYLKKL